MTLDREEEQMRAWPVVRKPHYCICPGGDKCVCAGRTPSTHATVAEVFAIQGIKLPA